MHWFKAFHLISMVAWFSGLFYLPRLFVYHSMSTDKVSQERFKIMERKLYHQIMMPGMILTILFGVILLWQRPFYLDALWMQVKLIFVVGLVIYHFYCG